MVAENKMTEDVERYDPQGPPLRRIALEHRARYRLAAALAPGRRVLDLGCGEGYGSAAISDGGAEQTVGVEVSLAAVARAHRAYGTRGASYVVGDACALPFADASFDLVVSFEVIEHVLRPNKLLKEARRTLSENGAAVVSTPNRLLTTEQSRYHLVEYSPEEFADLVVKVFPKARVHGQHSQAVSEIAAKEDMVHDLDKADYLVAVTSPVVATSAGRMAVRLADVELEFQGLLDHYVDLVGRVDADRSNLRRRLQEVEAAIAGVDEDRQNLRQLAEERSEALAQVEADRDNLRQDLAAGDSDRKNLKALLESAEADRSNLRNALNEISADRDNLKALLEGAEADRSNLRSALDQISADRDNLQQAVFEITNDRDNLQHAITEVTNDRDNLQSALTEITKDRDNYQAMHDEAQRLLEAGAAEAQQRRETIDALNRELQSVLESKAWRLLRALRIVKR